MHRLVPMPPFGPLRAGVLAVLACVSCGGDGSGERGERQSPPPALVGREPIRNVHVHEKHSSSLISWRRAGVKDRILVHVDADLDLDWLPDETVGRIASAPSRELPALELEPFDAKGSVMARFGEGTFLYVASRLGIVREIVWVVPDGSLETPADLERVVRELLVAEPQMVTAEEAGGFRIEGRRIRGLLLGVPVTVCALTDVPAIAEPVLLDIDLSYFTVRSALDGEVDPDPWIRPDEFLQSLSLSGLRTDLVTVALSTMDGRVPPESRWLAREITDRLRGRGPMHGGAESLRTEALEAERRGDSAEAVRLYRQILADRDDDASVWYGLSRALTAAGRSDEGETARKRSEKLDPLLTHADLLEGERHWANENWADALAQYECYLERAPHEPFGTYARRRRAASLARLGRIEEAVLAYRDVVERSPADAAPRAELGEILRERGDLAGALEILYAARRLEPDVAAYAFSLGRTLVAAGRPEQAVVEIEAAVERRPCFVPARAQLAQILAAMGRPHEAAEHLRVALALEPADPGVRDLARRLSGMLPEANPR